MRLIVGIGLSLRLRYFTSKNVANAAGWFRLSNCALNIRVSAILALSGLGQLPRAMSVSDPRTSLSRYGFLASTEERRRETAITREQDGKIIAITKGSPELILGLSAMEPAERTQWGLRVALLAGEGQKIVACASRVLPEKDWVGSEPEQGFRFAGLLLCEDPVRKNVSPAIAACRDAGIHVLMVIGDHPATAYSVARKVGLGGGSPVVATAPDIDARLRTGGHFLRSVDVIARATPSEKLVLVVR
jgi:magnesium-transporting ATPase (P-type)